METMSPYGVRASDSHGVSRRSVVRRLVLGGAAAALGRTALMLLPPAPVGAQEETPSPQNAATTDDTVFSWTVPAAVRPTGDIEGVVYRLTLHPGTALPFLLGPYCTCTNPMVEPGIGVEVVEAGTYTIRLDAPFTVVRDGTEEAVAAGTEATLGPGDVARFPDYAAPGEIRNAGSDDVTVLGLAMLAPQAATGTPVPALPQGAVSSELAQITSADWSKLPPGPITVTLRRLALPAGAALAPYEPVGLETILVDDGQISLAFIPVGETQPSQPLVFRTGHATPFLRDRPGTRRVISNDSDEPAAIRVLTLSAAGTGEGTPGAS